MVQKARCKPHKRKEAVATWLVAQQKPQHSGGSAADSSLPHLQKKWNTA